MAGYAGYSKSNNAVEAEKNERYPLSKAFKVLAKKLSWSQAKAKAFLLKNETSEWHHSSKFYNVVDYYDVSDQWIEDHKDDLINFKFEKKQKEKTVFYFNCWNWHRSCDDPRQLDWKISNRHTHNSFEFSYIKKAITEIRDNMKARHIPGKKAKDRIFAENMETIENILTAIQTKDI